MDKKEICRLLNIERECVNRNKRGICDRNCSKCDLVQDTNKLIDMYDEVIKEMNIRRIISELELLKDAIEWEYPIDFQCTIDETIEIIRMLNE